MREFRFNNPRHKEPVDLVRETEARDTKRERDREREGESGTEREGETQADRARRTQRVKER